MSEAAETVINETAKNATVPISIQGSMLAYGSLYLMAMFCIFLGSFRSVGFVKRHVRGKKLIENSITWKDARMFPLTASGVLFSLYVIFKYNDELHHYLEFAISFIKNKGVVPSVVADAVNGTDVINGTVNGTTTEKSLMRQVVSKENFGYFLLILLCYEGSVALAHLIKPFVSMILFKLPFKKGGHLAENFPFQLLLTRGKEGVDGGEDEDDEVRVEGDELWNWKFDTHDLVSLLLCSFVGLGHILKRHWITNNVIGISFCLYGIEALHLASFPAGAMLLAGLFVYDVFWVFATDVMATVATSIQAPILLMFPQDLFENGFAAKKYAMLGLGDIVIPGIFLALLLRFDKRAIEVEGSQKKKGDLPQRAYFYITMGAYAAGLVMTIAVMHYFKAAQPALLYLVPACVGAPTLVAALKGEFSELTHYSEEHLVKKDDVKEDDTEKKDN